MTKKDGAILFLQRSGFSLCTMHSANPLIFQFTPEVIRDLDVLKPEQFDEQLTTFFTTNKIPPMSVAIVLSDDVLFEKDVSHEVPKTEKEKTVSSGVTPDPKEEEKQFLDTVPYENLTSKSYQIGREVRIVATNREIFDHFREVFQKNSSTLESITPLSVIFGSQASQFSLNSAVARQLFQKLDFLKQQSLPIQIIEEASKTEEAETFQLTLTKGGNTKRLIILVAVFVVLFVIMGVMLYKTMVTTVAPRPVPHAKSRLINSSVTVTAAVTLVPSPVLLQVTDAFVQDVSGVRIHIISSSFTSQQGQDMKKKLVASGFKIIDITLQSGTQNKTIVVFSHALAQNIRDRITSLIQQTTPVISVQETIESSYDVTVSIL